MASSVRSKERPGTAAGGAKAAIRDRILRGEIKAGQRLTISDVIQLTGFGQMPVREAMLQLEGEGVLELAPHRGATVRPVDPKFVYDMYEVRRAMDLLLVRRAVRDMRADVMARLVAAQRRYEEALDADTATLLARNSEFHAVINQAGDNPVAEGILNRGWEVILALRMRFGFGRARLGVIASEHRALVDAIAAGDEKAALAVTDRHTIGARDDLLALLA
jgi:DNA-binding GntR family transcriptional regulator